MSAVRAIGPTLHLMGLARGLFERQSPQLSADWRSPGRLSKSQAFSSVDEEECLKMRHNKLNCLHIYSNGINLNRDGPSCLVLDNHHQIAIDPKKPRVPPSRGFFFGCAGFLPSPKTDSHVAYAAWTRASWPAFLNLSHLDLCGALAWMITGSIFPSNPTN